MKWTPYFPLKEFEIVSDTSVMSVKKPQTVQRSTMLTLAVGLTGCAVAYAMLGAGFWAGLTDEFHGRLVSQELLPFLVITPLITVICGSAIWRRYHGLGSVLLVLGCLSVFLTLLLPQL